MNERLFNTSKRLIRLMAMQQYEYRRGTQVLETLGPFLLQYIQ